MEKIILVFSSYVTRLSHIQEGALFFNDQAILYSSFQKVYTHLQYICAALMWLVSNQRRSRCTYVNRYSLVGYSIISEFEITEFENEYSWQNIISDMFVLSVKPNLVPCIINEINQNETASDSEMDFYKLTSQITRPLCCVTHFL